MERRLSETHSARGILLADGFPPHAHPSPAGPRSGWGGGRGSDSPPPSQRTRSKPKRPLYSPLSSLSTPHSPAPSTRTSGATPHPGGAPPGSVRPETPAGRRVRALTPGPESLPTTGPAGSLRPPPAPRGDTDPTDPLPVPATQLQHTKPHKRAAAALCAPTRPGPAQEAGGGRRGRAAGTGRAPPHRCEPSAAPRSLTR